MDIELIRNLVNEKASLKARIALIPFDGSIEVKGSGSRRYIYARKRVAGRNTSTYLCEYSDESFALLSRQAIELRALKKDLRRVERDLAAAGYEGGELAPRVRLNVDFARANVKTLIYEQAVLEGVSTTFPQTEDIIDNGIVSGVKASDVQKILNLKHAWEFVLDPDVVAYPSDFSVLCRIAALVNEGFYEQGGRLRTVPVLIGGCSYVLSIPDEADVKAEIAQALREEPGEDAVDAAIRLCLRLMKRQAFIDGNKRTAVIFCNHILVSRGEGILAIPEQNVPEFRQMLVGYYDGSIGENELAHFVRKTGLRSF